MGSPVKVERHRHGEADVDLTPYVGDLVYTNSVTTQGQASVLLRWPFRQWPTSGIPPVLPGDWIVVRDEGDNGRALWVGRVEDVGGGRGAGFSDGPAHQIQSRPLQVTAITFQGLLAKARVLLAPGMKYTIPGALYQFRSWGPAFTAWMQALEVESPGALFSRVFREMARQKLPQSLGGQALGDALPLVWDDFTAPELLKPRMIRVPGVSLQAFGNVIPSGTVWSMLEGCFGADQEIVELFTGPYAGEPRTAFEQALGCHYPLVYRMAPLHPTLPPTGPGCLATGRFQEGGGADFPYFFTLDDVLDWGFRLSEAHRFNGYSTHTMLQPASQLGAYGILGTPIIQPLEAENHGLRLREAPWPFFPVAEDKSRRGDFIDEINALNEYAAHALQDGHLKMSGALQLRPDLRLRPGVWALAEIGADLPFSCYLQSVTHRVTVQKDTGTVTQRTSVGYVRGQVGVSKSPTPPRPNIDGVVQAIDLGGVLA